MVVEGPGVGPRLSRVPERVGQIGEGDRELSARVAVIQVACELPLSVFGELAIETKRDRLSRVLATHRSSRVHGGSEGVP